MKTVVVITDSIACLTKEQVQRYEIKVVPLYINFEGRTYRDAVDITPAQAYELFLKNPDAFTTSASSPTEFLNAYHEASRKSKHIMCITLSSKLSTTCSSALLAKEYTMNEIPDLQIEVMDSQTATAAEGFVALAASQAAAAGMNLAGVRAAAEEMKGKVNVLVLLDTIKHVYRSGRVPRLAAQAGSILNIRPLFSLSGGVNLVGVVRSFDHGIDRMIHKIKVKVRDNPVSMAVMHAYAPEACEKLKERVANEFNCIELWSTEFSPLMGYACGTGTLAIAYHQV